MFAMSPDQRVLMDRLLALKDEAGSHSPSMLTIIEEVPEVALEIDACFLSNPYATELFLRRLETDLIASRRIRDVLEFYPSQNTVVAASLAPFLEVAAERIFIGNGAIEVIQAVLHRFAQRKIAVNIPTFSSYYEFAPAGVEVVQHRLDKAQDYRLDVPAYLDFIRRERPDTAVLINPNNPDGGYLPFAKLREILAGLADVQTVIVDESFIHFAYEDDQFTMRSAIGLLDEHPGLVVVKSMSKDFGIAGIRAGYGVMAAERVSALLANGYLWNINGLAEYFFKLYVEPEFQREYEQVRVRYINESQEFFRALGRLPGVRITPSMANFVLLELLDGPPADDFVFYMLVAHGVYTRTCSDKIGLQGHYMRVASRTLEQNRSIINAISSSLAAWQPANSTIATL